MNRTQLINEILQDLFVLDAVTVTAPAEDVAVVSNRMDLAVEYLKSANVAYVADADSVEDRFAEPFIRYLVQVLAPKFGRPRDAGAEQDALRQMRRIARLGTGRGVMLRVDRALRQRHAGHFSQSDFTNGTC